MRESFLVRESYWCGGGGRCTGDDGRRVRGLLLALVLGFEGEVSEKFVDTVKRILFSRVLNDNLSGQLS